MHVHAGDVVGGVVDRLAVLRRIGHVTQRTRALEYLGADVEVVGALPVVLGRFATHVREGLIDAAGLVGIGQVGVLLGVAVRHLVAGDVGIDQRIERGRAVTKGHLGAVPERVLVVGAVVDLHDQLEGQRIGAGVGLVHVLDHATEIVRVIEGRKGAVDRLDGVARAGIAEIRVPGGGAVEVHGAHVGVVHGAGRPDLGHVVVAVQTARAPLVLPGLAIAARAGADCGMGQAFPLLQHAAVVCIDDDEGTRRGAALRGIGEHFENIRDVGAVLVIDEDHLARVFAHHFPVALATAEGCRLADRQCVGAGELRGDRRQLAGQVADFVTEKAADVATLVFGNDDLLAPYRQAAEGLLVTGVLGAVLVLGAGEQLQAGLGVQAEHLGVAVGSFGRHAGGGSGEFVLAVEQGDILGVQVATDSGVGRSHGKCQGQRRERDELEGTAVGMSHCWISPGVSGSEAAGCGQT